MIPWPESYARLFSFADGKKGIVFAFDTKQNASMAFVSTHYNGILFWGWW